MSEKITVKATINAPISKVWDYYNNPEHIVKWNSPSEDWHTPKAENDLKTGGKFLFRMEAKDESAGFDFGGVYDSVEEHKLISYTMDDGREAEITFNSDDGKTTQMEIAFDPENENSPEFQQAGWQAILDNFKKYTENN